MKDEELLEDEKTNTPTETPEDVSKKKEDPKPTTSTDGAGEVIKPIGEKQSNPKKK